MLMILERKRGALGRGGGGRPTMDVQLKPHTSKCVHLVDNRKTIRPFGCIFSCVEVDIRSVWFFNISVKMEWQSGNLRRDYCIVDW